MNFLFLEDMIFPNNVFGMGFAQHHKSWVYIKEPHKKIAVPHVSNNLIRMNPKTPNAKP